jgi:hypothetical protein
VALTGQGDTNCDLERQWRKLADRFRRIADNDRSESDVMAAAADGGRLLYAMKAAGLLPNIELPPIKPRSRVSDDDSHEMAAIWYGIVAIFPGNPSHVQWEHRGGPNDIRVGSTSKADWSIRAEKYAAVCDALADECASTETATKGQGSEPADDPRPEATINMRMLDALTKTPECRNWSAQQWATHLGCAKSTVAETDAWKSLKAVKGGIALERLAESAGRQSRRRNRDA